MGGVGCPPPVDCQLTPPPTADECTASCGTLRQRVITYPTGGGAACPPLATHECLPGEGSCPFVCDEFTVENGTVIDDPRRYGSYGYNSMVMVNCDKGYVVEQTSGQPVKIIPRYCDRVENGGGYRWRGDPPECIADCDGVIDDQTADGEEFHSETEMLCSDIFKASLASNPVQASSLERTVRTSLSKTEGEWSNMPTLNRKQAVCDYQFVQSNTIF